MVQIECVVFAAADQAEKLLRSFACMARDNLQDSEAGELGGYAASMLLPGIGELPAHRGVKWEDMDAEAAIDEWVEEHADTLPFLVVMSYDNPPNPGYPLMVWRALPGQLPHTIGNITEEGLLARMESFQAPVIPLLEAATPVLLAHDEMQDFRAVVESTSLDARTMTAQTQRPGPRI